MTPRTWWVARDKQFGASHEPDYVLSRTRLFETEKGWRTTTAARAHAASLIDVLDWNAMTDFRLKPGEGPIQVTLEVRVKRV